MNKIPYFILPLIAYSCASQDNLIEKVCSLPKMLKETSAIEIASDPEKMWTLLDAGNKPELYAFDRTGKIMHTISISGVQNTDWEDLTSDSEGNLYIGNFGNNDNDRKDLAIYKIAAANLRNAETEVSEKITFYYPEQKEFPPKKSGRIYDVESFFIFENYFYLFTKNRSTKSDGTTMLYKVPNAGGNHAATLLGSFKTCTDFNHCAVTSADISPDGKRMVLLSASYIWLFSNFTNDDFFNGDADKIDLKDFSQKEGICFSGNSKLLITDEQKKNSGGNLYELDLAKLKSKP